MDRVGASGVEDSAGDVSVYFLDLAGPLPANDDEKRPLAGVNQRIHRRAPAPRRKFQPTKLIHDNKVRSLGRGHIERTPAEAQTLLKEMKPPYVTRVVSTDGQRGAGFISHIHRIESDQMSTPINRRR